MSRTICLIPIVKDTENKKPSSKKKLNEGEKGRNQGLRLSKSGERGCYQTSRLMNVYKWNKTFLLLVYSLRKVERMNFCKFQVYWYSSCKVAQVCWAPFLSAFCLFSWWICFAIPHCSCFFHFSACTLSDVHQFIDSALFSSQGLHNDFCGLITILTGHFWTHTDKLWCSPASSYHVCLIVQIFLCLVVWLWKTNWAMFM